MKERTKEVSWECMRVVTGGCLCELACGECVGSNSVCMCMNVCVLHVYSWEAKKDS